MTPSASTGAVLQPAGNATSILEIHDSAGNGIGTDTIQLHGHGTSTTTTAGGDTSLSDGSRLTLVGVTEKRSFRLPRAASRGAPV